MKKPNRRSKRTSIGSSSPSAEVDKKQEQEQQQHSVKRVHHLEKQNEVLKLEIEDLKNKLAGVSPTSVHGFQKLKEDDTQKFHALEREVMDLQKKLNAQSQYSALKQKNSEGGTVMKNEIQRLKVQKVQLLCKLKLESVQFRLSKASLEKEVLQLKKDQRRNEYEMRKLLALNQRQKLVVQRKTEEASLAAKRVKELLESRKAASHTTSGARSGNSPGIQGELELKVAAGLELKFNARLEEIRSEYERQMEEMSDEVMKYEEEAEMLRQENFRFLLEDKENHCIARDAELRDLKEEVFRLSKLVSQIGMPKAQVVHIRQPQVSLGSSVGSLDMGTSEPEYSGGVMIGKATSGACCSCSKKSLCKTMKCECRAASGCCGTSCGCSASKCTNREALSIKVHGSLQPDVAQELVHSSGTSEMEKEAITNQQAKVKDAFGPRRKALQEIGNIQVDSAVVKRGKRTKGQKPTTQSDLSLTLKNAEGLERADEISTLDIPTKLTRATRSKVTNKKNT